LPHPVHRKFLAMMHCESYCFPHLLPSLLTCLVRFRGATDMAGSSSQTCLYVGDEVERCLFKIGVTDGCERWSLDNHKPWCVSVTYRDNVLVTLYDVDAILEYRADGKCVRQLSLELAGIVHVQQTLHVAANQLLVCHATRRVSLLDSDGMHPRPKLRAWYSNGSVSDWWPRGCWFDSRPVHYKVTTLGKLFTHMCLCSPSSIIWYRPKGSDALWLKR